MTANGSHRISGLFVSRLKVILPGGAGLVGQNLVVRLKARGETEIVVIDKHVANLAAMRKLLKVKGENK